MASPSNDVVIVGAGLAGLSCALFLEGEGLQPLVLEAADRPGGRVRTDEVDGFLLDRGFQVLLSSYPTARAVFDFEALELCPFQPGALVRRNGSFDQVSDPRRRPATLPKTLTAGVGGLTDKLRILGLARFLKRFEGQTGTTAHEALCRAGFSERMIESFFRPFLGGVFLERDLTTDASFLAFVWSMFSKGEATLPRHGMQELPRQLVGRLSAGSVRTGVRVEAVEPTSVRLEGGERIDASAVVIATDGGSARALLGGEALEWNGVSCLYYDAPEAPVEGPWLILDGEGRGVLNNVCFPSQVSTGYAPPGRQLVSVSTLGGTVVDQAAVLQELTLWFGASVRAWRHLATYRIPRALPANTHRPRPPIGSRSPFLCGDHTTSPSIEGALLSGRRAATAVCTALGAMPGAVPR